MKKFLYWRKFVMALIGIGAIFQIASFAILLFFVGSEKAQIAWSMPASMLGLAIALPICLKYFSET